MTIDPSLSSSSGFDAEFFRTHSIALVIASGGKKPLGGSLSSRQTLKNLLANMCEYGGGKAGTGSDANTRWRYVPGNGQKNPENCLRGHELEPDCECLAKMFELMAKALGFAGARARKIERPGHRVVTEPIPAFDGRVGEPDIEYRWCFGDHWVVDFESYTFDPTYNLSYATTAGETAEAGFGWWAREVRDTDLRHGSYYKHPSNRERNIYVVPLGQNRPRQEGYSHLCGLFSRAAVTAKPGGYETYDRDEYGVKWSKTEKFQRWTQSFSSDRGGDTLGEMVNRGRD